MKKGLLLIGILIAVLPAPVLAEQVWLVEMDMTEPWDRLPDIDSISVVWHSDTSAILAVKAPGMELISDQSVYVTTLTGLQGKMDYYIVSSRDNLLPESWDGIRLKSDHHLVAVPSGTIMPPNRSLGYQRLQMTSKPVSSLKPPVYTGYTSKDFNPVIQSLVEQVQGDYLHDLLVQMVSFVTRYSYTTQCVDAVNWAADEFESWGYDVEQVPHTSGMAPNLIAWKYGSENPDRIWVVGGHYDSTSQTPSTLAPGANDNGTGSALTMCCANLLKDMNFADTVVYALWTGEEQGLYGSAHWAAWAAGQGLNIQGYYNFDMIGWVEPYPEDLEVLVNNASLSFGQDFVDVADMYTALLHNLQVANVTASDHYSFWQNGYVAFCGIEDYWPVYPYYHTTNDTVDKIDIPFFTEVTKAMVANICTAAQLTEVIGFNQVSASCNDTLDLFVIDFDSSGVIAVQVHSDTESTPETVLLLEGASHTFEGSLQLTTAPPVPGDGFLSVSHGDSIIAVYAGVFGNATVSVDCLPPGISNVSVSQLTSQTATITFTTSESATGFIRFGETQPDTLSSGSSASTTHAITLTDLDPCTLYYFQVEAEDAAGNQAVDDAGGVFHTFVTYERVEFLTADMNVNPGWTYQGQWAWGQPTGQGGEYGSPDPSGGYTGLNVVGYNLNGDYPNSMSSTEWATTQAFNCSEAAVVKLEFWCWLGVEQSIYDHAYIAVSNNNGTSWTTIWENSDSLNGGSWELWEFDISAQAAGYSQVKVRWGMGPTDSGWRYCGWNIDDVAVFFEMPCVIATPTPAPTSTPGDCLHTGDVNLSGEITAGDAQMAFQITLGTVSPTYEEACAADCNGDGDVTAGDAQTIFMAALGIAACVDPL